MKWFAIMVIVVVLILASVLIGFLQMLLQPTCLA
jgi:hypothetical protein